MNLFLRLRQNRRLTLGNGLLVTKKEHLDSKFTKSKYVKLSSFGMELFLDWILSMEINMDDVSCERCNLHASQNKSPCFFHYITHLQVSCTYVVCVYPNVVYLYEKISKM